MEFADLIKTPRLENVLLHDQQHATVEGTLCITGHHLLLSSRDEHNQELWLMHKNIDVIERRATTTTTTTSAIAAATSSSSTTSGGGGGGGGIITLKCKDLRIVSLEIRDQQSYQHAAETLEALAAIHIVEKEYAFFYRPMYSIFEDGHTMYSIELEFAKLTALPIAAHNRRHSSPNPATFYTYDDYEPCEWRITHVNKDFCVCPTYSAALIVPKAISDEQIISSASYRDGGRFPVLSYRHRNGATLLRSSQPMPVQGQKRCRADESLLNIVLGRSSKGFIIDTWAKGKSNAEVDEHYAQWKKVNRAIGQVSSPATILECFSKFMEACNDLAISSDKWLSRLHLSGWLSLVANSMNAACVVAQCLDMENSPVLVTGAAGVDSTLLVTSVTQIILNADCRTFRGFLALIEREWILAGHPFATRHRHGCYSSTQVRTKKSGATFVLFLDCVHQLHFQFPASFEFSTRLLISLYEHSYYTQYGTFICDSERERHALGVRTSTTSLWSHLNRPDILKGYLNPLYEPNPNVIWPSVAPASIELWRELYLRWLNDDDSPQKTLLQMEELVKRRNELKVDVNTLRKQAMELNRELLNMTKHGDM